MSSSSSAVTNSSERFTGRVKWFNNKAGYGFITVTDGSKSGTDVFVHHSSIKVDSEQYKYLVQGEYIEFTLSDTKTSSHEFQAGEVSGIKGGKLMCETRRESRTARTQYHTSKSEPEESVKMPRSVATPRTVRARGQGPREESNGMRYVGEDRVQGDSSEWKYVGSDKNSSEHESRRTSESQSGVSVRAPKSGRGAGRGAGRGRGAERG